MIRAVALLLATGLTVWGQAKILAIVDAAAFQPGLPYGGGLATIFVVGSGPQPGTYAAPPSGPLPFVLAGVAVQVNSARCPLLAVVVPSNSSAPVQINFQVPLERNGTLVPTLPEGTSYLLVRGLGSAVIQTPLPMPPAFGGFFTDGNGYVTAQHASDYSPVTTQNPAHPGETIIAYADDFFPVWPAPPIGFATPLQPLFQFSDEDGVGNLIGISSPGGLYLQAYTTPNPFSPKGSYPNTPPLTMLFQGLAPGLVGVEQINFVVPANQQPGNWSLFFNDACPPGQTSRCPTVPASSPYAMLPVR
jgi:uncharacterized protein (TIGR03437 family)